MEIEITPYHSDLRVVFEDPDYPDHPAKVLIPDPTWMALAMEGHLGFGKISEEQAIEFLIMKDIPQHVWDGSTQTNRKLFQIVKTSQLPPTREWRTAWRLKQ